MTNGESYRLRRFVYALLITIAASSAAGRILYAQLVYEPAIHRSADEPREGNRRWPNQRPTPMPTFSSNDRSRWCTVRALVENGTYAIGKRETVSPASPEGKSYRDTGIVFEDGWTTVDKVLHPERQLFYSSKPPLLPTLVAGEYWLLHHLFGMSMVGEKRPDLLVREPAMSVIRICLFTWNLIPFVIYLVLLARLVDRYGQTDWGRFYVVSAACFGTLVLPFLITFNNHTLATCCALFALYPVFGLLGSPSQPTPDPVASDDQAEKAAEANELQLAHTSEQVSSSQWRRNGAMPFLLAGFFASLAAAIELPAAAFAAALFLILLRQHPGRTLKYFVPAALIPAIAFFVTNYLAIGEWKPAYAFFNTPWYQYEGSHWKPDPAKTGIDFLEEPKTVYAFHLLFGHHGLFSLTPVFLLSLGGLFLLLKTGQPAGTNAIPRSFALLTALLLVVVVGFYIWRTNNYGGWTCGPRWLMWLTPFLLISLIPAADKLSACRWGRTLAYLCLGVSIVSATYPSVNPWRHPWLYDWMASLGWIQY
ncbi:MAG: hypothetical protein KatS3mg105_3845 [Gemmatales bacterium]|nr:MAG: hypothetical protein KatS3mg105_3845 [Gemmatales bacterium]